MVSASGALTVGFVKSKICRRVSLRVLWEERDSVGTRATALAVYWVGLEFGLVPVHAQSREGERQEKRGREEREKDQAGTYASGAAQPVGRRGGFARG